MSTKRAELSHTPPISAQTLNQLVTLLVDAVHPRKIILFGSYARGEQTRDSDLDVTVIMDAVHDRVDEMVRLRRVLAPIKMPIDVLVYSEHDVRERGRWLGTALRDALQEGLVLYGEGLRAYSARRE
jgi:uncharacterized protein